MYRILQYIWTRIPTVKSAFYSPVPNSYLFLAINGAGLGHLTRSLAVARKLRQVEPRAKIHFVTTSIGVNLVVQQGFVCHHIVPASLLGASSTAWNIYFFKLLVQAISIHRPSVLIFDGSAPYIGLQRVLRCYRGLNTVWIKRGLNKNASANQLINASVKLFHRVIVPSEVFGSPQESSSSKVFRNVGPICMTDSNELLSSEQVRLRFGCNNDRRLAYVQLGAGNINQIEGVEKDIVLLLRELGYFVVLGRSPISIDTSIEVSADAVISEFPNAKLFAGFDLGVLAAGYNSVCEAVMLGLPTILVPNLSTGSDDQAFRAAEASKLFPVSVLLLEQSVRKNFLEAHDEVLAKADRLSKLPENGAEQAAFELLELKRN